MRHFITMHWLRLSRKRIDEKIMFGEGDTFGQLETVGGLGVRRRDVSNLPFSVCQRLSSKDLKTTGAPVS